MIIYQIKNKPSNCISKVLPLNNKSFVVLSLKLPNTAKVEIIGINSSIYYDYYFENFSYNSAFNNILFKYKDGFGVFNCFNTFLFWGDIKKKPKIYKIKNPFQLDGNSKKYFTKIASFDDASDSVFLGLEEKGPSWDYARYWTQLHFQKKKLFGINIPKTNLVWKNKNELPLQEYPQTWNHKKPNEEWLNICDLMIKQNEIFIHTNGGKLTRVYSVPECEFSIISQLTLQNKLIRNFPIKEGNGFFTSSKDYFILQNRENKELLTFYETENFEIESEILLHPKRHLDGENSHYLKTDFFQGNLYLYNANFLNICMP